MPPLEFGEVAGSASGERYGETPVLYRDFTLASTLLRKDQSWFVAMRTLAKRNSL
jgi:hypothetical protein